MRKSGNLAGTHGKIWSVPDGSNHASRTRAEAAGFIDACSIGSVVSWHRVAELGMAWPSLAGVGGLNTWEDALEELDDIVGSWDS